MKEKILGFNQNKLIDNKLDTTDALILDYIYNKYLMSEYRNIDGIKYMYINYTDLLELYPIIGSKRNLMRKIENYDKKLLIFRSLMNEKNGIKGNFAYIFPTENLKDLRGIK